MTKKECDCIFCNFKCPECGAEEIEITYSPVLTCHNDWKDKITFVRDADRIELYCNECEENLDSKLLEDREKLGNLIKAMDKLHLDLPTLIDCEYNEKDHTISVNRYKSGSVKERGIDYGSQRQTKD